MSAVTRQAADVAVLSAAVRAIISTGVEAGRAALGPISGAVWNDTITLAPLIRDAASIETARDTRSFSAGRCAAVMVRDRFACRYCGARIVPRRLLVALSSIYPRELPYYAHYKRGSVHRVYWIVAAETDHLLPGGRGGDWRDEANLVTACVACNTRKGSRLLDEIGWTLRPIPADGWDGLTSAYGQIWELAGRPAPQYHRPVIAAFARTA